MPYLALFPVLLLMLGFIQPVQAEEEAATYNYRNAPKDQMTDTTEEEKAEARKEEDEDLTPQQKADRERRKITGESSDVPHGDEEKWPHIGRKR